ncbi:MAG: hypothetical protein JST54_00045 [Deltaproteobacteria bacterium]|nr:hypothetical protein [Deltaproteobacteria bacterium]
MRKLLGVLGAALILVGGRASADTMNFQPGALIIPMQSSYQLKGGAISAFGLVYRILQANAPGHLNASHPVTVYIVNNDSKASPNRCTPNNLATRYSSSNATNTAGKGTGTWNDGCDFTITNNSMQPVVAVDYSKPFPTSGFYDDTVAVPTYDDTGAWPRWTFSAALSHGNGFKTVSYLGAPFVIDAPDAPYVINLMQNGDNGPNSPPKAAYDIFSDTQKSPTAACNATSLVTTTQTVSGVTLSSGCHYVAMHQATTGFTANVDRRINVSPPAFLEYEPGTQGSGGGGVLAKYIQISGLMVSGSTNHADTYGCPVGTTDGCTFNGSTCTSGTECPAANVYHGTIFDSIGDTANRYQSSNYPHGILNAKANGYHLYWAPHWDGSSGDATSVQNLVYYTNQPNTGVMTECASITLYENGSGNSKTSINNTYGGPANSANFLFTKGIYVKKTDSGPNCTDPDWPSGNTTWACYPNPSNIFAQVGDWKYVTQSGSNDGYEPLTSNGSALQSWTAQMVTTSSGSDAFDFGQQDAKHAAIVYVSGHDVSGDANGARVVLNTMLNLSAAPIASERGIAAPVVAYGRTDSATNYNDELITPTYEAVTGYGTNPAVVQYAPTNINLWVWPYYPGNFRAHDLTTLTAGNDYTYTTDNIWDAANVNNPEGIAPNPAMRNIFTYFGGYPKVNPSTSGGGKAPHNILQVGWTPEAVDGTLLTSSCSFGGTPATGCVDVMGYAPAVSSPTFDDGETNNLHMVVGADGFCDLQQNINFSKLNSGSDWGGNDCDAHDVSTYLADAPNVAEMLQRVRGYCYAGSTSNLTPTDAQCTDGNDNRAHLGGDVHSTPAVVPPSPNITDLGAKRPTVAYTGTLDGQLHAIYVGGGSGYKGPDAAASPVHFFSDTDPDPTSGSKFKTHWGGTSTTAFTPPAVGTELWSYLPASQLPHLSNNSAQVDSSPAVMDVFADFSGSGLREWHTVLVASVGPNGNEIFAMDVTNPLHPRLLWDIVGNLFQTGSSPSYSPTEILNDSLGHLPPTAPTAADLVPKWKYGQTKYLPYPATDTGRVDTKVYDYQDLGGSTGVSLGEMRVGLEPEYAAFVTSNMNNGNSGIEVFAIDVATGQKLWQWEKPYTHPSYSTDALPPPATVTFAADGVSSVLVGDLEGQLWELSARNGANANYNTVLASCSAGCDFPAFDVQSTAGSNQPITTNIAVAKVPTNPAAGTVLKPYPSATVLIFGTAGADWVATPSSDSGKLHVVLYDQKRVPVNGPTGLKLDGVTPWTAANTYAAASTTGVLQEPTGFPVVFAPGERVYGNITISGSDAVVSTASGTVGDIMQLATNTGGHTYYMNLGKSSTASPFTDIGASPLATFGGAAVYNGSGGSGVLVDHPGGFDYVKSTSVTLGGSSDFAPNSALSPSKKSLTYRLRDWILRFLK